MKTFPSGALITRHTLKNCISATKSLAQTHGECQGF